MNGKLRFKFEKGGELIADLLPKVADETVTAVLRAMPLHSICYHTRWCGREIYTPCESAIAVGRENQTSTVNTGDVTFWREWGKKSTGGMLSVYYGAEIVRHHTGFLQVNVFACVSQDQWEAIKKIGERIWQQGIESIQVSIC